MNDTRHRLLEGVLLRVSQLAEADQFVLRGGMLLRFWFRPLVRPASDLDLVCTSKFDLETAARRLVPLLSNRSVGDGVVLDAKRFRVQGIWLDTPFPGVRLCASATVAGVPDQFTVDVTFGEPLIPRPTWGEYPLPGRQPATIRMCRPETIVGRKLHALWHMGIRHWRPKDLNDVRLLLERMPMSADDLSQSIAASFTSRGDSATEARTIFGSDSWWHWKTSSARWHDFVTKSGTAAPVGLESVVAEVERRLVPVLELLS